MLAALLCSLGGIVLLYHAAVLASNPVRPYLAHLPLEPGEALVVLLAAAALLAGLLALLVPWPRHRRHSPRGRREAVALALSTALLVCGVGFAAVELGYMPRPPLAAAISGGLGLTGLFLGLALAWGVLSAPVKADRTA